MVEHEKESIRDEDTVESTQPNGNEVVSTEEARTDVGKMSDLSSTVLQDLEEARISLIKEPSSKFDPSAVITTASDDQDTKITPSPPEKGVTVYLQEREAALQQKLVAGNVSAPGSVAHASKHMQDRKNHLKAIPPNGQTNAPTESGKYSELAESAATASGTSERSNSSGQKSATISAGKAKGAVARRQKRQDLGNSSPGSFDTEKSSTSSAATGHKTLMARRAKRGEMGLSNPDTATAEPPSSQFIASPSSQFIASPGAFSIRGDLVRRQDRAFKSSDIEEPADLDSVVPFDESHARAVAAGLVPPSSDSHQDTAILPTDVRNITEPDDEPGSVEPPITDGDGGGLPVAITVDEEQASDAAAPVAEEYNPAAKVPLYKTRRFKVNVALGFLALVGIIVGIVVGVGGGDDGPTASPTLAPTTAREGAIVERFVALVGPEVTQEDTPAFKAAEWILHEDPMALDENAPNLEQRFLMAYVYYFTTQSGEWRMCGKAKEGEDPDAICYFEFDNPDDFLKPPVRWLSGEPEYRWAGTFSANIDSVEFIKGISLVQNDMKGPLPAMLDMFPYNLEVIELSGNEFSGTIPDAYTKISGLRHLDLGDNFLTGTISPNFYNLTNLEYFNVSANELEGPINGTEGLTLANLKLLYVFSVFDNDLTGLFPTEIGVLELLESVLCQNNGFAKHLPTELGKLPLLQELHVSGNTFSGTIPSEIGLATGLVYLDLANNNFTGPIPKELFGLTNLEKLFLGINTLNGTLSPSVAQLSALKEIVLEENQLTGTIPSELGSLPNLWSAHLHRNLFTGSMPQQVCANVGCGKLEFLQADCHEPAPEVSCDLGDCCTACCEKGEGASAQCFKAELNCG